MRAFTIAKTDSWHPVASGRASPIARGGSWYPVAFSGWDKSERAAIQRVVDSGWHTMGPETAAFESELAAYNYRRYAIACNSGSSANLMAAAALCYKADAPLKSGDRALVPALAWATTYAPLVQHGLDLILADAEPSWNAEPLDPRGARLVVTCPVLGSSDLDLTSIATACALTGAYLLNDACESIGARLHGMPIGHYGTIATASFFWSHQLSAIEGGAVLTDDEELAVLCHMLRDHGLTRSFAGPQDFDRSYDFRLMGYNLRPAEINMAAARVQLKKLDAMREHRMANWVFFRDQAAARLRDRIAIPPLGHGANPFGLHFTCASNAARTRLVTALQDAGIDSRLPTGGSLRKHAYGARWAAQATPAADDIHARGLFLGNAPFPITEKIERAIETMEAVL